MATLGEVARLKPVKLPATVAKFVFQRLKVPEVTSVIPPSEEARQKALRDFQKFKADMVLAMDGHVTNIRAIESMSKEESALYSEELELAQSAIKGMLTFPDPVRVPALLAYAKAMVGTCPQTKTGVEATALQLANAGFLKDVQNGECDLRIFGRGYDLVPEFRKENVAIEAVKMLSNLVQQVADESQRQFAESFHELEVKAGNNPISLDDLLAGKEGRGFIKIPDNVSNGRFYKGGFVLVESVERQVRILGGVGSLQKIAERLVMAKTGIPVGQIMANKLSIHPWLEEEQFKNCRTFQKWLQLVATKAAEAKQREQKFRELVEAERTLFAPKATVSVREFILSNVEGDAFIDFGPKPFNCSGGRRVKDVFCIVRRNEQGQICVAECPERLQEFFAENLNNFKDPDQDFRNLGRLGQILRYERNRIPDRHLEPPSAIG